MYLFDKRIFRKYYAPPKPAKMPKCEVLNLRQFIFSLLNKEKNVAYVLLATEKYIPGFLLRYLCRFTPYFSKTKVYIWDNEKDCPLVIQKKMTSKRTYPILFNEMELRLFEKEKIDFYTPRPEACNDVFWGQFNDKYFSKPLD